MTNLQQNAPQLTGKLLRRLWFWSPIALGLIASVLLAGSLLVPTWLAFQRDTERLQQLEALRQEVALMRAQMKTIDQNEEKAASQKLRLRELVTGRGEPATFLAMLDREARVTGVRLDLFEPQAVTPLPAAAKPGAPAAPPPAAGAPAPAAAAGGVPEIEGLERRTVLVSARGSYAALLAFLRRVEQLSVLVVQNDLSLSLDEPKSVDPKGPPPPPAVVLKLAVSFYAAPQVAGGPAAAAAPSAPPPAAGATAPPPAAPASAPPPAAPAAAPARP